MVKSRSSILTTFDGVRRRSPAPLRRAVRRWADPLLAPWGSVRSVRTTSRSVALTFDDGPDPAGTPAVLDALAEARMQATFFVLVDRVTRCPAVVRRTIAEGHDLALHGGDHRRLTTLAPAAAARAIADGKHRLEDAVGQPVRFFRPPFGAQSLATFRAARRCGLEVVVWSADARDWDPDPPRDVAERALAGCRPGAVVLLHDGRADGPDGPPTPSVDRHEVARLVLAGLSERGLASASLSSLAGTGRGRFVHAVWFRP
jgi:peptidoglycan/xylan/chitin deacetylase (PgdA/CDA1 family)